MNTDKNNTQLPQSSVSDSTYSIFYDLNNMKMWLSPSKKEICGYTCVSHRFTRFTYNQDELFIKIMELTKKHPTILWLYEVVV